MLIDFRAAVGALSSIVASLRSIYITKHACHGYAVLGLLEDANGRFFTVMCSLCRRSVC